MTGPTPDDDNRATTERALMFLRAAAGSAIHLGDRALGLDVARRYRRLLTDAADVGDVRLVDRIVERMAEDGARIRRDLGTSAWDEPETSKATPPAPAIGFRDLRTEDVEPLLRGLPRGTIRLEGEWAPPRPITDGELNAIVSFVHAGGRGELPCGNSIGDSLLCLVDEVRRLRFIDHELRLVLQAALGDDYDPDLHPADLVRRLEKQRYEKA
jgi:hypothetical protein